MRSLGKLEKAAVLVIDFLGEAIRLVCSHRRNSDFRLSEGDVRKLLLLEQWGIGDFVMASHFLPAFRKYFDPVTITVLCSPAAAELLAGCPYVDDVVAYKFPWTRFHHKYLLLRYQWRSLISVIFNMRQRKFDVAVTGFPDPRVNLLLWLFGARHTIGFGSRGGGFFLTNKLDKKAAYQHHLGRWKAVLQTLGCQQWPHKHVLWLSRAELQEADRILARAGISKGDIIVGIHSGASNPQRRWPAERFDQVAERISRNPGVRVLVFSNPDGTSTNFQHNACVVLPKVNLRILTALLSRIDVLLCNDSGPMHIADAVGTSVVALFGRSDSGEFGPLAPGHTFVEAEEMDCRPCYVDCKYSEPRCWLTITVSEVTLAMEKQIDRIKNLKCN